MIEGILAQVIAADDMITARLGVYANVPAIFTASVIPRDAAFPAVLITSVAGSAFGCRDQSGSDIVVDVMLYAGKARSAKDLRATASMIWSALARCALTPYMTDTGLEDWGCQCDVPIRHDDEDGFPGYRMTVKASVLEV